MSNAKPKCPICGASSNPQYMPFCSKRCSDVDLGRWLNGTYVVQTNEEPESQKIPKKEEEE